MGKWVFQNNDFVDEEKALLSFRDISFQRGYGVFDFFRLVGDTPLFLDDHLDRFFSSAEGMYLPVPLSKDEIKTAVARLIRQNNLPNTGIRLSLTGGIADDGFNIGTPAFLISQHLFTLLTDEQVQKGVKLFSYPHQRQLSHIKSIDYTMAIWLQPHRIAAGADDILYHQDGIISESPRSNFFLVTADEKLITPAANILSGITRKKILQLAKEHFTVEERNVHIDEIREAKEAFLTSTTKKVLPVAQIDDVSLPRRETANFLLQLFRASCKKEQ